jgi:hypothetical protein
MNDIASKRIKSALIIILALVLVLVAYEVFMFEKFHLVSTDPVLNKINTSQTSISLIFNKNLSVNHLVVDASPINISSDKISGKTLMINFTSLSSEPYTINILSLYDTSGTSIKNLALNFTPVYIPFNQLPSSTQKSIINSQPDKNQPTSALDLLPYDGPDYELTLQYNTSNSATLPDIEFTYVPNTMDNLEGSSAEQAAINNAKDWLTNNGISLSTYSLVDSSTDQPL